MMCQRASAASAVKIFRLPMERHSGSLIGGRTVRNHHFEAQARLGSVASWMVRGLLFLLLAGSLLGCGAKQKEPEWPAHARKWYERAQHSFRHGDLEDARHASRQALKALPGEPKVRLIAARVALADLAYEESLQIAKALPGSKAAAVRGRAHWYLGHVEQSANELEKVITDPEMRDPWAEQVSRLARLGRGRRPFEISGALVAAVDMPRVGGTQMVVPLELNGEPALALVATDMAEAVVDSRQDGEGAWVSVRFGGKLEVSDVPAIGRDLSGLTRQVGAPVKMLIGVNLLRRLHATVDFAGRQFVARSYDPPAPPEGTALRPIYYRGGALVLPGAFGSGPSAPRASLLMNTSMQFPVALDEQGWKAAGQDPSSFPSVPGQEGVRHGKLPVLQLGAFEIPNVPGVLRPQVGELEKALDVELDGFAGSGLFATYRLTFGSEGKVLFMEDLPAEVIAARKEAAESLQRGAKKEPVPDVELRAPGILKSEEKSGSDEGSSPDEASSSAQGDRMPPPPRDDASGDPGQSGGAK